MTSQSHPLQPIGQDIYLYQPANHHPNPNPTDSPALITLCTWLGGATPQRIQKYIYGYRFLYPDSAILLITTRILEISALPFSVLHARLGPARDVIRQLSSSTSEGSPHSILLYIFSHGGCNTAIQLAISLCTDSNHPSFEIGKYLGVLIFDCCPGDTSFDRAYQAAALSLQSSLPGQMIGSVLLYPVIGLINGIQMTGWMSSVRDLRKQLNDPQVVGTSAARLYLYSTADRMVGWEDVESHQREAKSFLGCVVEGIAFPDSPHCALVRDHADRYGGGIKTFWTERRSEKPEVVSSVLNERLRSRL
ncbi:hypothetical protein ETB97_009063 [Aspergillus alliaceus]|uniref:Uncharacterized protein n=1 Tax=Petromyces alliaceus TaxID=209559 RepID=A0A8H6E939_PETAA|nr:hypothetical protein ETB97_009063 [Aspergillus burnettii]